MKLIATLILLSYTILPVISSAQNDTTYQYLDESLNPVASDVATYTCNIYPQLANWKKRVYHNASGKLYLDACYSDARLTQPCGTWMWYNKNGTLIEERIYDNSKLKDHYQYYNNSNIRMHANFKKGVLHKAEGWDSAGNKLPGFVYMAAAAFKGGVDGWRKYVTKHIEANPPVRFKSGSAGGVVQVAFTVDIDGSVSDVSVKKSSGFTELDLHAVTIIRNSPKWSPAIQYNEKVKFHQVQTITYKK